MSEYLDLELVHKAQDIEFYTKHSVKRGVAQRFVRNIELWSKQINAA